MSAAASFAELPPVTALRLVSTDDTCLVAAEALVASYRYAEGCDALEEVWPDVRHDAGLALRQRLSLAWGRLYLGELDEAEQLLEHAEAIATQPRFDAADRAEVAFRQGCVRLQQSRVAEATELLTRALELNERSPQPHLGLAARAHEWRSRCHIYRRDWDAAERDVERALAHAAATDEPDARAHALFQASIVAERQSQWLIARCYAEQALELYRRLGNRVCEARVLNNLGGIMLLLGDPDAAEESLLAAIETADAVQSEADFAQAVNSLAQVYLRTGRPVEARLRALRAVELLSSRADFLDELGNAQLVVGGSLQAEGETRHAAIWFADAEQTFERLGSTSHLATVWIAQADLARAEGDAESAADLYRRAASALQDVHF
jgi:tetratricopeptide (TPR) repeat protein